MGATTAVGTTAVGTPLARITTSVGILLARITTTMGTLLVSKSGLTPFPPIVATATLGILIASSRCPLPIVAMATVGILIASSRCPLPIMVMPIGLPGKLITGPGRKPILPDEPVKLLIEISQIRRHRIGPEKQTTMPGEPVKLLIRQPKRPGMLSTITDI